MKTGDKFHRLTAVRPHSTIKYKTSTKIMWVFQCECGKSTITTSAEVKRGHAKSCGCLRTEGLVSRSTRHGHTKKRGYSKTYNSWRAMVERCNYKNGKRYKDYGGRGITVCASWMDFRNFLQDMGERPDKKSLDRIDNEKGYFKENCRWATAVEQRNNRRKK